MNLEKAERRLSQIDLPGEHILNTDDINAIQLGIEAQERIIKGRAAPDPYYATLLPSETED